MRSHIGGKAKEAPGLELGCIGGLILTFQPSHLDLCFTLAGSEKTLYMGGKGLH